MGFRNKCRVAGAEGVINLSIPLEKGRDQRTVVKDVRIADGYRWQDQHWKTLLAAYSRSPWFEFYRDELGKLYERKFEFLFDWNLACAEWTGSVLPVRFKTSLTQEFIKEYPDDVVDGRGKIGEWQRNEQPVVYRQVFEERTGFMPHLSILDLLFCEGKRAASLLE